MLSLIHSKTEFLLLGLPKQLSKIPIPVTQMSPDVCISSVSAACNLGVIFDSHLSLSDHISAVSKFWLFHIRDLHHIHNTLDLHTAKIIATALVNSRLDLQLSLLQSSIFSPKSTSVFIKLCSLSHHKNTQISSHLSCS
jgi:hypothetical protein